MKKLLLNISVYISLRKIWPLRAESIDLLVLMH